MGAGERISQWGGGLVFRKRCRLRTRKSTEGRDCGEERAELKTMAKRAFLDKVDRHQKKESENGGGGGEKKEVQTKKKLNFLLPWRGGRIWGSGKKPPLHREGGKGRGWNVLLKKKSTIFRKKKKGKRAFWVGNGGMVGGGLKLETGRHRGRGKEHTILRREKKKKGEEGSLGMEGGERKRDQEEVPATLQESPLSMKKKGGKVSRIRRRRKGIRKKKEGS